MCAEVAYDGASADLHETEEQIGGAVPSVHCSCHSGPAGCSTVFFASASGMVIDRGACIGSGALAMRHVSIWLLSATHANLQHIAGCALLSSSIHCTRNDVRDVTSRVNDSETGHDDGASVFPAFRVCGVHEAIMQGAKGLMRKGVSDSLISYHIYIIRPGHYTSFLW